MAVAIARSCVIKFTFKIEGLVKCCHPFNWFSPPESERTYMYKPLASCGCTRKWWYCGKRKGQQSLESDGLL